MNKSQNISVGRGLRTSCGSAGPPVGGCEILHHLGWLKPYKYWEEVYHGLSTGAGFLPSTV